MLSDNEYASRRRPQLEKVGIDKRSIDYLIGLERGSVEAVITSLKDLRRTAVWTGRVCRIKDITLVFTGLRWVIKVPVPH